MIDTSHENGQASSLPRFADARLAVSEPPRLIVVVDTEEEFDWSAPFSASNTAVTAMQHIHRVQDLFDRYQVKPTYVIDYPVASQDQGAAPLLDIWRRNGCAIGAHLHPWVNPPYDEQVNRHNSFTCNLPVALQRRKLKTLTEAIADRFSAAPRSFKAGRYGLGRATVGILEELGYSVDNSVSPRMDFTREGGPSFAGYDAAPFFLTESMLEVPCTIDYVGWSGAFRPALHRLAAQPVLARARAVGVLARAGAVNQIMLSPEGNTFAEMRALTRSLFARGCRAFTFSFHSPSVEIGHTPYVQNAPQLQAFLDTIDRYCEFFFRELGGASNTLESFRAIAAGSTH